MDLKPITAEECKDVPAKGKGKALLNAYAVAAEGHDLEHFRTILADHQLAVQQELEAREAKEAAKADKQAKKNKRKSTDVVEDEDVDMDDVGEEEVKKPKSSKKRKKSVDADAETSKVSYQDILFRSRLLTASSSIAHEDPQDGYETEAHFPQDSNK